MTQKSKLIEFKLANEKYTHLKFKSDESNELYFCIADQDKYNSITDIKHKICELRNIYENSDVLHSVNQYELYINELVLDVQLELDNKTAKSI